MSDSPIDIDSALEHLDPSISPLNSISSDILEATLPTILAPPHPQLTQSIINDSPPEEMSSPLNSQLTTIATTSSTTSYSNALKTARPTSPLFVTIDNDPIPPKKKYDMMQDTAFLNSGIMPPILLPLKSPSHLTNVSPEFLQKHPEFKPNLPALYMTPTSYKFRIPQDRSTDHYITYASRNMSQLQYWQEKKLKFFCLQYNFLKPTPFDLGSHPADTTPANVKRIHHQTYQSFLEMKTPQNFLFQNHKFTSPFTYLGQYHLDHHATVGQIRNYDPVKQMYIFMPYKDPTRPLIVPQEYLVLNDDYLTHANIPTQVHELSPYFHQILSGPLNNNELSYYTTLVQKRYTHPELMYIIAKFSTFLFQKQYKYGPLSKKLEQPQPQPQPQPPPPTLNDTSFTLMTPPTTLPQKIVTINTFTIPIDVFITEILQLLQPHVNNAPTINPMDLLKNIFSTYQLIHTFTSDLSQLQSSLPSTLQQNCTTLSTN